MLYQLSYAPATDDLRSPVAGAALRWAPEWIPGTIRTYGKSDEAAGSGVTFFRGSARHRSRCPGPARPVAGVRGRHQRTRIQDATTFVLAEHGYGAATIGDIVARAHVSRRTFYAHFETKEHCVLATFGAAMECIADAVRAACGGGRVGRRRGRRADSADAPAGGAPADGADLPLEIRSAGSDARVSYRMPGTDGVGRA